MVFENQWTIWLFVQAQFWVFVVWRNFGTPQHNPHNHILKGRDIVAIDQHIHSFQDWLHCFWVRLVSKGGPKYPNFGPPVGPKVQHCHFCRWDHWKWSQKTHQWVWDVLGVWEKWVCRGFGIVRLDSIDFDLGDGRVAEIRKKRERSLIISFKKVL